MPYHILTNSILEMEWALTHISVQSRYDTGVTYVKREMRAVPFPCQDEILRLHRLRR